MKIKCFFITIACLIIMSGCENRQIKEEVEKTLSECVRDKNSLKIDKIIVKKDTVPVFFESDIQSLCKSMYDDVKYGSTYDCREKFFTLKKKIESAKPEIQYIACAEFTANNAFGAAITSKAIFIIDKDTKKVLAYSDIDEELTLFAQAFCLIKNNGNPLKKNKYGKEDISSLPFAMQCILCQSLDEVNN